MIGYWIESGYLNTIVLGPCAALVASWWRWVRPRQLKEASRTRRIVTVFCLTVLTFSVLVYLFLPVVEPCDASGCAGPEHFYMLGIGVGFWLGLAGTILSSFATRGIRALLALAGLSLVVVWFVVAMVWND
jgi:hypothetical protein